MDPHSPDWLTEPCPPWCRRKHAPDDHPEDRRHQGAPQVVTVRTSRDVCSHLQIVTDELVVHADSPIGDPEIWIRIESLEDRAIRLAMTQESVRRLLLALQTTLGDIS